LRAKPNLAAGLFMNFGYEAERLQLERGSRLILYTDGVTEAERSDKAQFGDKALLDWAGNLDVAAPSNEAALDLFAHVRRFVRDAEQNDDITIMSIVLK
jgi:sigma-B regulation protein RsbU (phosphoserine phosphatase)